jgi:hypothetical protein
VQGRVWASLFGAISASCCNGNEFSKIRQGR